MSTYKSLYEFKTKKLDLVKYQAREEIQREVWNYSKRI